MTNMSDASGHRVVPSAHPRDYAAASASAGNEAYLGHRLTYRDVESQLDDEVSLPELLQVLVPAGAVALIVFFLFLGIGVAKAAESAFSSGFGSTDSGSGASGWVIAGFLLSLLVFAGLLRAMRADVGISEWSFLVDGKADASHTAYTHITEVLKRRQVPVSVGSQPVRDGRGVLRQHLVISSGPDTGFVAVYPFGTSLYLGWMLWRPQNGWTVVGAYLRQIFVPRARMDRLLAATPTRALREAVHNATREGIDIAAERAPGGRQEVVRGVPEEEAHARTAWRTGAASQNGGQSTAAPTSPTGQAGPAWDPFSDD